MVNGCKICREWALGCCGRPCAARMCLGRLYSTNMLHKFTLPTKNFVEG
nr:MAG TPA: hypothetical protein [Caudoviricetes sp.]